VILIDLVNEVQIINLPAKIETRKQNKFAFGFLFDVKK
jgi:hypothetical protein